MVGNRSLPQGSVAQCNPSLFLSSPFSQTAEDCWASLCGELVSPRSAGPRLKISYFAGLLCTEKGPSPVSTCIPTAKLSRSTWTYATVTDIRRFRFAPCAFPCSPPRIHHKALENARSSSGTTWSDEKTVLYLQHHRGNSSAEVQLLLPITSHAASLTCSAFPDSTAI